MRIGPGGGCVRVSCMGSAWERAIPQSSCASCITLTRLGLKRSARAQGSGGLPPGLKRCASKQARERERERGRGRGRAPKCSSCCFFLPCTGGHVVNNGGRTVACFLQTMCEVSQQVINKDAGSYCSYYFVNLGRGTDAIVLSHALKDTPNVPVLNSIRILYGAVRDCPCTVICETLTIPKPTLCSVALREEAYGSKPPAALAQSCTSASKYKGR